MAAADLSAERLRELLDYDPLTGGFTNRTRRGNRALPGAVAGGADGKGYRIIEVDGRAYRAHRLAWLHTHGRWPAGEIDHIDRNPANNTLANLRDTTRSVNQQNRRTMASRSGVKGVTRNGKGWQVRIWVGGEQMHLGQFDCPKEAERRAQAARCMLYPGHPGADIFRARLRDLGHQWDNWLGYSPSP